MTGQVDGSISLEAFPSLDVLFELNEMYDGKSCQALKAGDLSDLVINRLDPELNSSSLMDDSVLDDTKMELDSCSGSDILMKPWIPSILYRRNFSAWCVNEPLSVLPPDRVVRH